MRYKLRASFFITPRSNIVPSIVYYIGYLIYTGLIQGFLQTFGKGKISCSRGSWCCASLGFCICINMMQHYLPWWHIPNALQKDAPIFYHPEKRQPNFLRRSKNTRYKMMGWKNTRRNWTRRKNTIPLISLKNIYFLTIPLLPAPDPWLGCSW